MVAELNRRYLELVTGFSLLGVVRNGQEALEFVKNNKVDLVLLDIFMPGMDGLELLAAIRREQYGVDVILVTAAHDKQSIQAALRQGAVDYLIKPFEFTRFQSALQAFKKRHELIAKQDHLCQAELDKQILAKINDTAEAEMPKGLQRDTLKRIWQVVSQTKGSFTADELAQSVGLSQVSIRKYLKYLQSMDLLTMEMIYGGVGRPVYRYHCANTAAKPDFLD